jgi:hypothetical protein
MPRTTFIDYFNRNSCFEKGKQEKSPYFRGFLGGRGECPGSLWLLANFRGVPEGNGEEQGGNGQSQNQDVSEALHGEFKG